MMTRRFKSRAERALAVPRNNEQQAALLRRHFAPTSLFPPPMSLRAPTGNRNTALTATNSQNSTPTDNAQLRLQGGQVQWFFKTKFQNPPTVTASAITQDGSAVTELYIKGLGTNVAAIIVSTDPADNRVVNLHAVGNPN